MANIILRLTTGSAGTTSTGANGSIGGAMGTDAGAIITTANTSLNNLFDNISKLENNDGTTDYRCIMIHNDTLTSGEIFATGSIFLEGSPKADISIGLGDYNVNAEVLTNENTVPADIIFSQPTEAFPLAFPGGAQLDANEYIELWVKRTAQNVAGAGTITDIITVVVRGVE
ncbi:hypothetical protein N9242_00860 [Vicingaceae bacterium]|nr:hypothetical protein [Vicingaceae bacterium]